MAAIAAGADSNFSEWSDILGAPETNEQTCFEELHRISMPLCRARNDDCGAALQRELQAPVFMATNLGERLRSHFCESLDRTKWNGRTHFRRHQLDFVSDDRNAPLLSLSKKQSAKAERQ